MEKNMTVKSKLLGILEQQKGETLSGEKLAEELHCTRAAIWKAVKALREEGYTIEAGQNKGYMLVKDSHRLSVEAIRPFLVSPEVYLKVYQETDSTNRAAKEAAVTGTAGHGGCVVAGKQTAGRGRRGRSFYSPEEAGLYLSVILKPQGSLRESLLLTAEAAVAVYKAVLRVTGISLDIKWVNDLYYHDRKVCGILTEAVTDFESGEIDFAVVGIGLNLYEAAEGYPSELRGLQEHFIRTGRQQQNWTATGWQQRSSIPCLKRPGNYGFRLNIYSKILSPEERSGSWTGRKYVRRRPWKSVRMEGSEYRKQTAHFRSYLMEKYHL